MSAGARRERVRGERAVQERASRRWHLLGDVGQLRERAVQERARVRGEVRDGVLQPAAERLPEVGVRQRARVPEVGGRLGTRRGHPASESRPRSGALLRKKPASIRVTRARGRSTRASAS